MIQIFLIIFGLLIFIGYFLFNLLAYIDYSREDLSIYAAARWRPMIYGILLFAARIALFCRDACGERDKRSYQIGTWVLQGIYAVLGILSVILLLQFTKGQYVRETIHYFIDLRKFWYSSRSRRECFRGSFITDMSSYMLGRKSFL